MFKSEEHKIGFHNLAKDYELLCSVSGSFETRMFDKMVDDLTERLWDEIYECLEDDWFDKPLIMARFEAHPLAGSIEALVDTMKFYEWAGRIPAYLIEAYEGFYEDEIKKASGYDKDSKEAQSTDDLDKAREWVWNKIHNHTPREQLKVFLEWNGILGWQNYIENILVDFPLTQN